MSLYSKISMYMATAKRGTWTKFGEAAKALTQLYLTAPDTTTDDSGNQETKITTFHSDFSVKTDGAFFIASDGKNLGYRLMLVAPDDHIDVSFMDSKTISDALNYLSEFTNTNPVTKWDDFLTWFNGKWTEYGQYKDFVVVQIAGSTINSTPNYNPSNTSQSVWFAWLKSCVDNSGAKNYSMSTLKKGNGFSIPFSMSGGGTTASMYFEVMV